MIGWTFTEVMTSATFGRVPHGAIAPFVADIVASDDHRLVVVDTERFVIEVGQESMVTTVMKACVTIRP